MVLTILIIVVLSLLGGAGILGFALFLFNFYRSMNRLIVTVEALAETVVPLAKSTAVQDILLALKRSNGTGQAVVEGLKGITAAVKTFNTYFSQSTGATAATEEQMPEVGQKDFFMAPTDEQLYQIEQEKLAREAGLVPPDETPEPGLQNMNVANV